MTKIELTEDRTPMPEFQTKISFSVIKHSEEEGYDNFLVLSPDEARELKKLLNDRPEL